MGGRRKGKKKLRKETPFSVASRPLTLPFDDNSSFEIDSKMTGRR